MVGWNGNAREVILSSINAPTVDLGLLKNIGLSKAQMEAVYGDITDSYYYLGGKYYKHEFLESAVFYENPDNAYDYNEHDDAPADAKCMHMEVKLSELIPGMKKNTYSISDLQSVFGSYKLENNLEDENFPECYYTFYYGDYTIRIISDRLNPPVEFAFVFKN